MNAIDASLYTYATALIGVDCDFFSHLVKQDPSLLVVGTEPTEPKKGKGKKDAERYM